MFFTLCFCRASSWIMYDFLQQLKEASGKKKRKRNKLKVKYKVIRQLFITGSIKVLFNNNQVLQTWRKFNKGKQSCTSSGTDVVWHPLFILLERWKIFDIVSCTSQNYRYSLLIDTASKRRRKVARTLKCVGEGSRKDRWIFSQPDVCKITFIVLFTGQ